MSKFGCFASGVVVGALGGGIAALLLTPKTGEENRALVADYATNIANNAQSYSDQVAASFQDGIKQASTVGGNFVGNVKSTVETAGTQFNDRNDELRAKIEAARDRIAQQVKKNAEQDEAEDDEISPAEVESEETAEE